MLIRFLGRYKIPLPWFEYLRGEGGGISPTINGQWVNTLKLSGGREYLLVFGHLFGEHEPSRVSLPIFEVLEVAAANGGPDTPGGRSLIYLQLIDNSLVRRVVVAPPRDHIFDGLYRLADGLRDCCLNTFRDQTRDQLTNTNIVSERSYDAAAVIPLASSLMQDGMGLDEAQNYREVAP